MPIRRSSHWQLDTEPIEINPGIHAGNHMSPFLSTLVRHWTPSGLKIDVHRQGRRPPRPPHLGSAYGVCILGIGLLLFALPSMLSARTGSPPR